MKNTNVIDLTNRNEVQFGHDQIDGLRPCNNAKINVKYYDSDEEDMVVKTIVGDIEEVIMTPKGLQIIVFRADMYNRNLFYLNGNENVWKSFTDEYYPNIEECIHFINEEYENTQIEAPVHILYKYFD